MYLVQDQLDLELVIMQKNMEFLFLFLSFRIVYEVILGQLQMDNFATILERTAYIINIIMLLKWSRSSLVEI